MPQHWDGSHLAALGRHPELPFVVTVEGAETQPLECCRVLRLLPGRRLSCEGRWRGRRVMIKLFFGPGAGCSMARELRGCKALEFAQVATAARQVAGPLTGGGHALVFDYLEQVSSFGECWSQTPSRQGREQLLDRVIGALVRLHEAGCVQHDLHGDNLLLAEDRVFVVDGRGVQRQRRPLTSRAASRNLALLLAQFPVVDGDFVEMAERSYHRQRGQPLIGAWLRRELAAWRRRRRRRYRRKCFRDCSAFVCRHNWSSRLVASRPLYQGSQMQAFLAAPEPWLTEAELLKGGRTSTVVKLRLDDRYWVIKRYNLKNPWHALKRALQPSRAAHAWGNALLMRMEGIATAEPAAFLERRWGPLRREAYHVLEFLPGPRAGSYFSQAPFPPGHKVVAEQLVTLLADLAAAGMAHGDLKESNFIITSQGPALVDLDAMRSHSGRRLDRRWKKDLERFLRNWEDLAKRQEFRQLLAARFPGRLP